MQTQPDKDPKEKGTVISKIHSVTSKLNVVSKANSTPRHKHHQNGWSVTSMKYMSFKISC